MQRARVGVRHSGDRRDPELAARAEDAQRDLAAVRYEELLDAHEGSRFSRNARRPSWPSSPARRPAAMRASSRASDGCSRVSRFAARVASGPDLRIAALEERGEALLALGARAALGDRARRLLGRVRCAGELLRDARSLGAGGQQLADDPVHRGGRFSRNARRPSWASADPGSARTDSSLARSIDARRSSTET